MFYTSIKQIKQINRRMENNQIMCYTSCSFTMGVQLDGSLNRLQYRECSDNFVFIICSRLIILIIKSLMVMKCIRWLRDHLVEYGGNNSCLHYVPECRKLFCYIILLTIAYHNIKQHVLVNGKLTSKNYFPLPMLKKNKNKNKFNLIQ